MLRSPGSAPLPLHASCLVGLVALGTPANTRAMTGTSWTSGALDARADVRVCWARSTQYSRTLDGSVVPPDPGTLQIRRWVRQAVENTWGRYANITTYHPTWDGGWMFCTSEQEPGTIVFSFADSNRAEIGRFDNAATHVQFDASMQTRAQFELAAISLFAQAMQLIPQGTMLDQLPSPDQVLGAQQLHGLKANGALVGYGGRCATPSVQATGMAITPYPCFAELPEQAWTALAAEQPAAVTLAATFNGGLRCIPRTTEPPDALPPVGCDTVEAGNYAFADVQWVASGQLCVTPDALVQGASLELRPCELASHWDVSFLGPTRLNVHETNLCAGIDGTQAVLGQHLTLGDCDLRDAKGALALDFALPQQVTLNFGQFCAATAEPTPNVGSVLVLGSCAPIGLNSAFHLRARLRSGSNCAAFEESSAYGTAEVLRAYDCADDGSSSTGLLPRRTEWDYYWQL